MHIKYIDQINLLGEKINYEVDKEKLNVSIGDVSDCFDFTGLKDGRLEIYNEETGEELIETKLPINPILSVEKKGGVLYLQVLNWVAESEPYEERFPEWIDTKNCTPSREVESDGHEQTVEEQ